MVSCMTTYNFDKIINRKGTNCLKYDFAVERGKPAEVLPLWVADMDFQVSEEITKSLHAAVEHGIYGYTQPKDHYYNAIRMDEEKSSMGNKEGVDREDSRRGICSGRSGESIY